jgi:SAM-dependent methyltransferase
MGHFKEYSKYYDLLYKDKDYQSEVNYIDGLIRKFKSGGISLLDIGCGTGKHANILAKKGYEVTGIDISETMLKEATANFGSIAQFSLGDIRSFRLNKKFDFITSLFHVLSYQITNDDLESSFQSVYDHLNDNGIFIFDCWYGPGVMSDLPSVKVKRMGDAYYDIVRIAEPVLKYNESVVQVNYQIMVTDLANKSMVEFTEVHPMRFLFKNEVALLAKQNSMKIIGFYSWLTYNEPTKDTWYAVFILQK